MKEQIEKRIQELTMKQQQLATQLDNLDKQKNDVMVQLISVAGSITELKNLLIELNKTNKETENLVNQI